MLLQNLKGIRLFAQLTVHSQQQPYHHSHTAHHLTVGDCSGARVTCMGSSLVAKKRGTAASARPAFHPAGNSGCIAPDTRELKIISLPAHTPSAPLTPPPPSADPRTNSPTRKLLQSSN